MLKVKSLMRVLKIQSNFQQQAQLKIFQDYMKQRQFILKKIQIMSFQIDGKIILLLIKLLQFPFQFKINQKITLQKQFHLMDFIHIQV